MRGILAAMLVLAGSLGTALAQSPAAGGDLEAKDPEGDVSLFGAPLPGAPADPGADLVSLRVHSEDTEGVWIEIGVKQLRGDADVTPPSSRSFRLEFRLERDFLYEAEFRQEGGFSNATPSFDVEFRATHAGGFSAAQRVAGSADHQRSVLTLYVPKLSLLGRNPSAPTTSRTQAPEVSLEPGRQLLDFTVSSMDRYALGDRLPDSGSAGPFVIRQALANDRIRLAWVQEEDEDAREDPGPGSADARRPTAGAFPVAGVEAGAPTPIKIQVENRNGAKRVINLTAGFAEPRDAERFSLRMAPSLTLPGNESRTVNLVVTVREDVPHRAEALVKVRARSLGYADEFGALTLRIVASVPPSASQNVLRFHAAQEGDAFLQDSCRPPQPTPFACEPNVWMNTLADDPFGTADKGPVPGSASYSGAGWDAVYEFPLDAPLARDLALNPKVPVTSTIKVVAGAAEGSVTARLEAGDLLIGEGTQTMKDEAAEVSFLPNIGAARAPAGSRLTLHVTLHMPPSSLQAAAARPSMSLPESQLVLPVAADAGVGDEVAPSLGEAFLSLSVHGDREEFVNPSEARAFRLTVVNEGAIEDVVALASRVEGDACRAEFRPGDRYRLGGGESASLGVLVHAPVQPQEGAQCRVHVNATSRVDPETVARVELLLTVTRGVDMPNDAENFTANQDAASKMDVDRKASKSPGPAPLLVLAAALVVAWRRRSQI